MPNGFFSNLAGQPKGEFEYRRWQASAGGPMIRNKTFWFARYEKFSTENVSRRIFTMPTPAERNGDFSALLKLGSQYQIYDPWTTTNLNNGRYSRQPFAGNIIPQNRVTRLAGQWDLPVPDRRAVRPRRFHLLRRSDEDCASTRRARPLPLVNTAGFETNSSRQRASAIRYHSSRFSGLRAAPINVMDLSAMKKTKLTERFSFELRAEAIDALNHAIFDVPNTSVTAGTFGTVTATNSVTRKVQFALYLTF